MKLVCNVYLENRSLPCGLRKMKFSKSTLALCKSPKTNDSCIILFTNQNKNGTRYTVNRNIKVMTRFVNEGKATIQFNEPPHNLLLQSDVVQLKSFVNVLRLCLSKNVNPNDLALSNLNVTPVNINKIKPLKLVIANRSEYPKRGFPRTLEALFINNIKRCAVDVGIIQLKNLRILDLSNNCIECIPEALNTLPNLVEFNISSNHLHRSSFNQWTWIGGNLSKTLQLLNLAGNTLKYIPDQIVKLHKLVTLNVNNNSIEYLPTGMGNLKNLKIFIASNNLISVLPGSVTNLKLQTLDLSNNNFNRPLQAIDNFKPKLLPVQTLKEYSARKVLEYCLSYSCETLPKTVISYLDHARYCTCRKACFSSFLRAPQRFRLHLITKELNMSYNETAEVPIDCIYCSLNCYLTTTKKYKRPLIR